MNVTPTRLYTRMVLSLSLPSVYTFRVMAIYSFLSLMGEQTLLKVWISGMLCKGICLIITDRIKITVAYLAGNNCETYFWQTGSGIFCQSGSLTLSKGLRYTKSACDTSTLTWIPEPTGVRISRCANSFFSSLSESRRDKRVVWLFAWSKQNRSIEPGQKRTKWLLRIGVKLKPDSLFI